MHHSPETIEAPHMGMRITWGEGAGVDPDALSFTWWVRGGAALPPVHVHPHQEEKIEVVSWAALSKSGGIERVLKAGESVTTPPGEPHTVGPAGDEDVEMLAELRPALAYKRFLERSFALDRAGYISAEGRGNPLRMATTGSREAEFFLTGMPVSIQRGVLAVMERLSHRLGYDQLSSL